MVLRKQLITGLGGFCVCLAAFVFAGCERKERVLDVHTPAADVKVDRNIDNGNVEVKTDRK